MVALTAAVGPAQAAAEVRTVAAKAAAADAYGYTVNVHSRKVIAILNASTANGAAAIQHSMSTALPNNDYMFMEWQGGSNWYRIKPLHTASNDNNPHNDKCLAVVGASQADNALIGNYTCSYDSIQNDVWLWEEVYINGVYRGDQFRNLRSGKCLVVQNASTANSARLLQYNCEAGVGAPYNELWVVGNV
jgi:hypothetical protein